MPNVCMESCLLELTVPVPGGSVVAQLGRLVVRLLVLGGVVVAQLGRSMVRDLSCPGGFCLAGLVPKVFDWRRSFG